MNSTGCEAAFARDEMFVTDKAVVGGEECTFSFPVYYTCLSIFALIIGFVAIIRTMLVYRTSRKSRSFSYVPFLIITASWLSFLTLLLNMIIPVTFGSANNAMIVLFGLQGTLFNFLAWRWLKKLIRLGSKIIQDPSRRDLALKQQGGGTSSSADSRTENLDLSMLGYLSKSDRVLKILSLVIMAGISFEFLCLCILTSVFPRDRVWLNIGIAMHGCNIFFEMSALLWQYQRCTNAITNTAHEVRQFMASKKTGLENVQLKFRKHQIILACTGLPGSLIYLLWGIESIPISYLLFISHGLFDSVINFGVLFTFVRKSKPSRSGTTNIVSNGSYMQGEITVAASQSGTWVTSAGHGRTFNGQSEPAT